MYLNVPHHAHGLAFESFLGTHLDAVPVYFSQKVVPHHSYAVVMHIQFLALLHLEFTENQLYTSRLVLTSCRTKIWAPNSVMVLWS